MKATEDHRKSIFHIQNIIRGIIEIAIGAEMEEPILPHSLAHRHRILHDNPGDRGLGPLGGQRPVFAIQASQNLQAAMSPASTGCGGLFDTV
jgi:hypothetical protein